jgi:MtrB/PioB family decaheme-associated outer membrane protein
VQSQKSLYRDQSYLVTFGEYGKFKFQFRYDEIPHVYSNTTRTLFVETSPGVWSFPASIRSTLQASDPTNLPSLIAGTGANSQQGVVTNFNFITPSITRKSGTISASYDLSSNLNLNGMYSRESQNGSRPIGLIMNSSPSASATSGFGVELPETISYFNNLVRVGVDYGRKDWGVEAAYQGSFLQENIPSMTWDNPFVLTQPVGAEVKNPTSGRSSLYPSNQANYLALAGAANLTRYLRLQAIVSPGWLRQDERFLPYTINEGITGCGEVPEASCTTTASLPAENLEGKQTLAMNFTLISLPWKKFQVKAGYRHYDYNNNTPVRRFTPVQGDASSPGDGEENTPFGFNRKNFELTGNWFFAKKSSAKLGYQVEWMDRSHRDVEHSVEQTFLGAVDVVHGKDLTLRLSYRHSVRNPDAYQDDQSNDPATAALIECNSSSLAFTADQRCSRRFDESHRVRNRGDALIEYDLSDRLSFSAFGGTIQDDYNQRSHTNSSAALNFLTGAAATTSRLSLRNPEDISYNYGLDADSRFHRKCRCLPSILAYNNTEDDLANRTPADTGLDIRRAGYDTANNDWESTRRLTFDSGCGYIFWQEDVSPTYYSPGRAL